MYLPNYRGQHIFHVLQFETHVTKDSSEVFPLRINSELNLE